MSKILKYIMIGSIGLLLANCSSSTYKIKQENNKIISSRFNGNIIMQKYPHLKGVELGKTIVGFKEFIGDKFGDFKEYVLSRDKNSIMVDFDNFNNLKE